MVKYFCDKCNTYIYKATDAYRISFKNISIIVEYDLCGNCCDEVFKFFEEVKQ